MIRRTSRPLGLLAALLTPEAASAQGSGAAPPSVTVARPVVKEINEWDDFIGRFEAMLNDRDDLEGRLRGFYASAEWKAAQRWIVGARLDRASSPFSSGNDRGASLLLTFRPSEFSQLRSQLRRTTYGGEDAVTELLVQLQFSIGAHGAHAF